jgi:uncharacterized Tic20 family protein
MAMSTPEPPENPEQPQGAQEPAPQEPAPQEPAQPAAQELPPPTGQPVAVAAADSSSDDRMFGVLLWIVGLFFSIIGPLIVWLVKRDQSAYVDAVGKTVLNFNISYTIWIIVTALLSIILIGIPFLIAAGVMYFVFSIVGAVKANQGEDFTPWLTIRFLK